MVRRASVGHGQHWHRSGRNCSKVVSGQRRSGECPYLNDAARTMGDVSQGGLLLVAAIFGVVALRPHVRSKPLQSRQELACEPPQNGSWMGPFHRCCRYRRHPGQFRELATGHTSRRPVHDFRSRFGSHLAARRNSGASLPLRRKLDKGGMGTPVRLCRLSRVGEPVLSRLVGSRFGSGAAPLHTPDECSLRRIPTS